MKSITILVLTLFTVATLTAQNTQPTQKTKTAASQRPSVVAKKKAQEEAASGSGNSSKGSSKSSSKSPKVSDAPFLMTDENRNWTMFLETNVIPVQSNGSDTRISFWGRLGLQYNIKGKVQIGMFGHNMIYYPNWNVANLEGKIVDLSSINYNGLGLTFGYKAKFGKFVLNPKLDASFDFLLINGIDFATNNKSFFDYRYLSLDPHLMLGFAPSSAFDFGLNIGYNFQATAIKGKKTDLFNPSGIIGGLSFNFNF